MTKKFKCPFCGDKTSSYSHLESCKTKRAKRNYKQFEKQLLYCTFEANGVNAEDRLKGKFLVGDPDGTYFSNRFLDGRVKPGCELRYHDMNTKWKLHYYWNFEGRKEDLTGNVEFTKTDFMNRGVQSLEVKVTLNEEFKLEEMKQYWSNIYSTKLTEACVRINGKWYLSHIAFKSVIRGGASWWFGEVGLHPYTTSDDLPTIVYEPLNSENVNFVNFDLVQDTYISWSRDWRSYIRILDECNTVTEQAAAQIQHKPWASSGDYDRQWPYIVGIEGDEITIAGPKLAKITTMDRNSKDFLRRRSTGTENKFNVTDIVNAKASHKANSYGDTVMVVVHSNDILVWLVNPRDGKTVVRLSHQCTPRSTLSNINPRLGGLFSDLGRAEKFKKSLERQIKNHGVVCMQDRRRYGQQGISFKRVSGVQALRANQIGVISDYRQKVYLQGNPGGVTKSSLLYGLTPVIPAQSWQKEIGEGKGLDSAAYITLLIQMETVAALIEFDMPNEAMSFLEKCDDKVLDLIGFHPTAGGDQLIFQLLNCDYLDLAKKILFHDCRFREALCNLRSSLGVKLIIAIYLTEDASLFENFVKITNFSVFDYVDSDGNTLFHYAVVWGDLDLVHKLLSRERIDRQIPRGRKKNVAEEDSLLQVKNSQGATALCLAVTHRRFSFVKDLVIKGADPLSPGMWGNSALQMAFLGCDPCTEIINFLLRAAKRDQSDFERAQKNLDCEGIPLKQRIDRLRKMQILQQQGFKPKPKISVK